MSIPLVTVLMSVYNGQRFLGEAIESILGQSLKDFEFIIIDDASTDNSRAVAEGYHDQRIKIVSNRKNMRLAASLNRGIHLARGKYIARMDADDISLPQRLEKQAAYMEDHPEIGVSGSWLECFGDLSGVWDYPADPAVIRAGLLFQNQLGHPTVIMRRETILRHGLFYDPDFAEAEDYKLWTRCARCFPLGNLGEVLLMYRWHESQASRTHSMIQRRYHGLVCQGELRQLGIEASEEELALHLAISFLEFEASEEILSGFRLWLLRLWDANQTSRCYPSDVFLYLLENRWQQIASAVSIKVNPLFP